MTTRRLEDTAFAPGDPGRFVLPEAWGGRVRSVEPPPAGTRCEVEIPGRIHAAVLDMTRFDIGRPGGGGVGFAVGLFSRATVSLSEKAEIRSYGNRPLLGQHVAELFRRLTGYEGGIEIETRDHNRRHMGLGSSVSTLTAAAVALNEALGRPLDLRNLRKLVAYNYCEELSAAPPRLVPGFETNVGAMAGLHGGMVIATDRCELAARVAMPEDLRALLLLPKMAPEVSSGAGEYRSLLGAAQAFDAKTAARKVCRVFMDLLPAALAGDLRVVGDLLWELSQEGSKRAEIELHGDRGREILEVMEELRRTGAEIVGMSSIGPAVFGLSRNPSVWARWRDWEGSPRAACAVTVPVDNRGARVRLDGTPIPYRFEPWWHDPVYD
ncbi:GHMP family kinase ATP-binding protein [Deferrisoma palaeochoriense]